MSISDVLRRTAERLPEKPALVFHDASITYGELDERVDRVASGIAALGIRKGDRVAVLVANEPAFVEAYLGIVRAGAVMVPLNTMFTADEVSYILDDAEARAVIVGAGLGRTIDGMVDTLPMLEHVIHCVAQPPIGAMTWEQLLAKAAVPPDISPTPDDLACIAYTSGTTGHPKGAMLTHGNLTANLDQMAAVPMLAEAESDVVLVVLPLFHIYALNVILGLTVRVGATAVLQERFDPVGSLDAIAKHDVTILFGAPPMFVAWLATPGLADRDLSSVRVAVSGAAPLASQVLEDFREATGITIWEGYGLTETAPGLTSNAMASAAKPGSIGKPLPDVELRLIDESGEDVEDGDPGEIVVRGPNVFAGYWRRDAETKAAIPDGWFRTGDVAYADEDGYLFIVDRKKDLIIVSGFNVYPREVEETLFRHPKISDAAVIGIDHPYTGEAVKATVVLKDGVVATEDEIIEHCSKSLARFKCPQVVEFVATIPHTVTGKVIRRRLREDSGET